MHRTDFGAMACSIARTLDIAGETWTPLILRDVYVGIHRFDELQADLGISRKVLAERLGRLVDEEMLVRRSYSTRPPRSEYVLTDKGLAFCDVLVVMATWGDRFTAGPEGPPALYRHRSCGQVTQVGLRCCECDHDLTAADLDVEPGPGAEGRYQPGG